MTGKQVFYFLFTPQSPPAMNGEIYERPTRFYRTMSINRLSLRLTKRLTDNAGIKETCEKNAHDGLR